MWVFEKFAGICFLFLSFRSLVPSTATTVPLSLSDFATETNTTDVIINNATPNITGNITSVTEKTNDLTNNNELAAMNNTTRHDATTSRTPHGTDGELSVVQRLPFDVLRLLILTPKV